MQKITPVLLKPVEFAALTNQCKAKVYDGVATGAIPSVRVNGMIRIPAAYVEKLVNDAMASTEAR